MAMHYHPPCASLQSREMQSLSKTHFMRQQSEVNVWTRGGGGGVLYFRTLTSQHFHCLLLGNLPFLQECVSNRVSGHVCTHGSGIMQQCALRIRYPLTDWTSLALLRFTGLLAEDTLVNSPTLIRYVDHVVL